jgi:hypothetical protein
MKACPTNFTLLCTSGYNWGKGVGVGVCGERCGHPGQRNKQQNKYFKRKKKRDLLFWAQNTLNYLSQISGKSINSCEIFYVHNLFGDGYYHYSPWVPKLRHCAHWSLIIIMHKVP